MRSSYSENNYGPIFRNIVISFKPLVCVELGVLDGYSSLWIGSGLVHNALVHQFTGHLWSYDLWEDYPCKHGNMIEVQKELIEKGVGEYVSLLKGDANEVHLLQEAKSIDILHIDISNTGDIFNTMVKLWHSKLRMNGLLLFEGGSVKRDQIGWMKDSGSTSIKEAIETNKIINDFYQYETYDKFPSLSVFIKKGE